MGRNQIKSIKWYNIHVLLIKMSLPGGEISSRPLHFFWIVDCSGSMLGDKIQTVNTALDETIPEMVKIANENARAQLLVRALKFSSGAEWVIKDPTPVEHFKWTPLEADGVTDLGAALELLSSELKMPPMPARALPPVLVLISDGQPTDDYQRGLRALMNEQWGKRAVRMAIAIGDADIDTLKEFIADPAIPVLEARNPQALTRFIKWVSTTVVDKSINPPSEIQGIENKGIFENIDISPSNNKGTSSSDPDVW